MSLLWTLMPDGVLPLVLVGIGIAIIVGLLKPAAGVGLVFSIALFTVISPFIEELAASLPLWLLVILAVVIGFSLFKGLLVLLVGGHAANHTVGILAADVIRALILAPFRLLRFLGRFLWLGRP